jgi:WD40 repeat protein
VVTFEYSTKKQIFSYSGHKQEVTTIACSPFSQRIASGSKDNTVQVWDAKDGRNVFTYRGHSKAVTSLAWSPNGKYIASADADGIVLVWQAS